MINYNKLKRLFKDGEWQTIDTYINVDVDLISKIDPEMIAMLNGMKIMS